jgi:hypothetical protein
MRRLGAIACALVWAAACAEEGPRYGPPGSIKDRAFGAGSAGASAEGGRSPASAFDAPYDAKSPPPAGEPLAPRHPYRALDDAVDCTECHKAGGSAAAKPWAFGGRVNDKSGTTTREVIVRTSDGAVVAHVKATSDGYFWAPGTPVANARTAVRNQNGDEAEMATAASGGCNAGGSCHGGATGPIVVPK